jgi:acyl phosphate:glycerol-3-phosphate acyltransferase
MLFLLVGGNAMIDSGQVLTALPTWAIAFAFGYLAGAIPFGLLITRLAGTQDIREIGSRNIGATNVLRTGRKDLAAATLICDALKGTAAVLAAFYFSGSDAAVAAASGAFLGHLFPVWLKFRGGKGVATFIGLLIAFAWPVALGFCAIWLVVAGATRYSSLSALIASAATPAMLWAFGEAREALLFAALAVLLWVMHRANIGRLLDGTEGRIGARSEVRP